MTAVEEIHVRFLKLKKLEGESSADSILEVMKKLDETEEFFLKLSWYFQEPDESSFQVYWLYKHFNDEDRTF
ncbi:hypothetical protein [Alkalihalobacillus pseudalcaliphilus]|uniref:hypothetical protein n=1 Tax=Alkalihalobacillus pseudalcaliphilus TaxID=79884 RepID=UPI00064DF26F|nr:hypothetical protein [Alkalihalobacillus pseudalcaliphilus]KMK75207.1 hypothetical protein AB990_17390 [Alkalihalobacillus pseudalcaliphilus]